LSLEKLRNNEDLSHNDIKVIESELKTTIDTDYPDGDRQATLSHMLRHLLSNSQAAIADAFKAIVDPGVKYNKRRIYTPEMNSGHRHNQRAVWDGLKIR